MTDTDRKPLKPQFSLFPLTLLYNLIMKEKSSNITQLEKSLVNTKMCRQSSVCQSQNAFGVDKLELMRM